MSLEPEPGMRASDAERDEVAARLRDAHAEGRLDAAEFGERLDSVFAARTRGELAEVTRDLPAAGVRHRPRTGDEPHAGGPPARRDRGRSPALRAAWGVWLAAVLVNVVIWAAVSLSAQEWVYFWPVWVAGPWGAVLLAGTLTGRFGRP